MTQTEIQDTLDVEAYPKPGKPNPIVDLFVYDVASRKTTQIDVHDGKPFADEMVGHYVYRRQLVARWDRAAPQPHESSTERARVRRLRSANRQVPRRSSAMNGPASWVENSPERRFLKDGKRFIWNRSATAGGTSISTT